MPDLDLSQFDQETRSDASDLLYGVFETERDKETPRVWNRYTYKMIDKVITWLLTANDTTSWLAGEILRDTKENAILEEVDPLDLLVEAADRFIAPGEQA